MAHPVSQDQAQGAMIGMALGDTFGFLVSGQTPRYCKDFAAHALTDDEPPWLERDGYAFGQYTVDTQLARELALSMIEVRGFDPARCASRVAHLFAAQQVLFAGEATARAGER
ncbi:MAG TPA: ADP-ribosylglycohydrolase family protein, partial [Myxococcota bacterium]|nr:ADP-ribosylglycohydrolase family protein [Myxococcota bacterium]